MNKCFLKWPPLYCMYNCTVHSSVYSTWQAGHFPRKDDSCDRTLVIYFVLFIVQEGKEAGGEGAPLHLQG